MALPWRRPLLPRLERLEDRACPSITLQLDYSFDSNGFFNSQSRRDLLQRAADTVAAHLTDNLLAINPTGSDTWGAIFPHPATGAEQTLTDLQVPANTLIVYAGGRPNLGSVGLGGPGGFTGSGSQAFLDLVEGRGQIGAVGPNAGRTDLGPWGGAIAFDTNANWHFGATTDGLENNETDFLSVAMHELIHLVGFGTDATWLNRISSNTFTGPLATAAYDGVGSPPTRGDGHWTEGLQDDGQETAMDPTLTQGTRKLITGLDRAALGDMGWQLRTDTDATLAQATATGVGSAVSVFTSTNATLDNGLDVDLYRFQATAGQQITLTTAPRAGQATVDTYLRIFDATGQEVASADNGGEAAGYAGLTFTVPSNGQWYVGVSSGPNRGYLATEAFALGLAGGTGAYDLTISSLPTVRFSLATTTTSEASASLNLTVQLSFPLAQAVSIPFTLAGTATNGTDYAVATSPLVIPGGMTSATILFTPIDDARDEDDETAIVTLGTPTNAALGTPASMTVTLTDNDPPPVVQFALTTLPFSEGTASLQITVNLSTISGKAVTVPITVGGTATSGADFTLNSTTVTIPAGQTIGGVTLTAQEDLLDEVDETVTLTLGTPTNATLGPNTVATVTLVDNDTPPTVQFTAMTTTIGEGNGTVVLTVQATAASALPISIPFTVSGTATSGTDFTAPASPLVIPAGQTEATLVLTLISDGVAEADESIVVTLGVPTNAVLGQATTHTVTLQDATVIPTVQITRSAASIQEGKGSVTLTVSLSTAINLLVTIPFTLAGTAAAGQDYTLSASPIVIPAGQTTATLLLTALTDSVAEAQETAIILLGTPTNAQLGGSTTVTVALLDDPPGAPIPQILELGTIPAGGFTVVEGSTIEIPIKRTGSTTGTVTVDYVLSVNNNLRLKQRADLTLDIQIAATATITFGPGESEKSLSFVTREDTLVEADLEFLTLTLQSPTGATLGNSVSTTVAIQDNDLPPGTPSQPNLARLQAAANGFGKSTEHYRDFVRKAYQRFLSREPDEQGFQYWVTLMQLYESSNHAEGLRQEQIEAGFINSQEYVGRYGGIGPTWIRGIYRDLLGREGEQSGVDFWVGRLTAGDTPATVALGFTASEERLRNRVTATYQDLLDRAPDTFGLEYWVSIFKAGGTTEDIISGFVGSVEYYNKTDRGGGIPVRWVKEAYLDVLFRPAAVTELDYWLNFLRT